MSVTLTMSGLSGLRLVVFVMASPVIGMVPFSLLVTTVCVLAPARCCIITAPAIMPLPLSLTGSLCSFSAGFVVLWATVFRGMLALGAPGLLRVRRGPVASVWWPCLVSVLWWPLPPAWWGRPLVSSGWLYAPSVVLACWWGIPTPPDWWPWPILPGWPWPLPLQGLPLVPALCPRFSLPHWWPPLLFIVRVWWFGVWKYIYYTSSKKKFLSFNKTFNSCFL